MATKALATEKQTSYLRSLIEKLVGLDPEYSELQDTNIDDLSKRAASEMITILKDTITQVYAEQSKDSLPQLEPGFYQVDGDVYEVKRAKTSGHLYARSIDPETGRFEYAKGAIYRLDGATPMTLREAAEFGRVTGRCIVCGRELTKVESIEAGIGPVCARRF
jgi:hypothetical protein